MYLDISLQLKKRNWILYFTYTNSWRELSEKRMDYGSVSLELLIGPCRYMTWSYLPHLNSQLNVSLFQPPRQSCTEDSPVRLKIIFSMIRLDHILHEQAP